MRRFIVGMEDLHVGQGEETRKDTLVLDASGSGRETRLSQDDTGSNSETLFSDEAELISAEEWLLQADYAAAKDTRKESTAAKRLSLIKSTLIDLLPTVSDIDILSPDDEHEVPLVVFKNADGWIPFSCLGLGHRTMIAWVVDLAARMLRRYPDSPNPIAEPAVVLIDEIDLHLHPSWQRTLMRYLSERFKNTQFIVTAHSPLVVQAATGANIAVLRRKDKHVIIDQSLKSVQGWRVDQLLTSDLFDLPSARSTDYDEMLSERRGLLAKPQLTASDKSRLRTLEIEADQLPSGENPTEMEANRIIGEAAKLLSGQTKARS